MCQDSTLWELQCKVDIGNATIIKNNYSEQVKLIRLYLYNYCALVSLTLPKQAYSGNTGTMNVNESTVLCLVCGAKVLLLFSCAKIISHADNALRIMSIRIMVI